MVVSGICNWIYIHVSCPRHTYLYDTGTLLYYERTGLEADYLGIDAAGFQFVVCGDYDDVLFSAGTVSGAYMGDIPVQCLYFRRNYIYGNRRISFVWHLLCGLWRPGSGNGSLFYDELYQHGDFPRLCRVLSGNAGAFILYYSD